MSEQTAQRAKLKKYLRRFAVSLTAVVLLSAVLIGTVHAAPGLSIDFVADDTTGSSLGILDVMLLFVVLSLIPSIMMLMTSFTRIVIVLSFMRNALGTQQSPPNQVLVGLAFFLTLFIMQPVLAQIKTEAYEPYKEGIYTATEALDVAQVPLKRFMLKQTTPKSLNLFINLSETEIPQVESDADLEKLTEISLFVIVPAFVTSELERAFLMGFLLYLPFLIIDIVVSSVLMSMGMVMLPPATISLPFKILLFVLIDGWSLLLGTLAQGFA
ncbi:MAG: flagellar type III secretion system pore protein FliP [Oscillospiraceae bacterium]|nr:flagellar type III secretion system pore protein FliP [Oscillospiraceae bacterium]